MVLEAPVLFYDKDAGHFACLRAVPVDFWVKPDNTALSVEGMACNYCAAAIY
ncbi:MAG: hypothetical protein DHS20C08_07120 [Rhodomicrobium sp.]|nr:MAG: hypothetical protein DHS20C08_07120 [Rhodomicrobium sp.]